MYLRSLNPKTETYLNKLAFEIYGNRKGNLSQLIEDLKDYLENGDGSTQLKTYLRFKHKMPMTNHDLSFLYKG